MALQVLAKDGDVSARGFDQPEQDLNRRCLARAVGAEDAHDLPTLDRKRHIGYRDGTVEFFAKMLNFDKGLSHARSSPGYEAAGVLGFGSLPCGSAGAGSGGWVGSTAGPVAAAAGVSAAFSVGVGGGEATAGTG